MKKLFSSIIVLLILSVAFSANITVITQPSCAYSLDGESYSDDSTFQPTYYNGNLVPSCKGLMATDTGMIYLWLTDNTTKIIFPLKIFSEDLYQRIPIQFKKIFRYGPDGTDSTMSLSNIYVLPDLGL